MMFIPPCSKRKCSWLYKQKRMLLVLFVADILAAGDLRYQEHASEHMCTGAAFKELKFKPKALERQTYADNNEYPQQ